MFNLTPETFNFFIRILIAALLGGLVGMERDLHGRAAGLRTHLLVSVGAAVFTIISIVIVRYNPSFIPNLSESTDPGRIAAQIVTGIGFLGAGAIIKEGFTIRGLTTAACLWIVAAIGMASGAGAYSIAVFTTVVALASLVLLHYLERALPKDSYRTLTIRTNINTDLSKVISSIKKQKVKILFLDYEKDYQDGQMIIKMALRIFHKGITDKLSHSIIKSIEDSEIEIRSVKWNHP